MSLQIGFEGTWDWEIKAHIESTLRAFVDGPPHGEEWTILVTSVGDFCIIRVRTAKQTRIKLFPLIPSELATKIPDWLNHYPVR